MIRRVLSLILVGVMMLFGQPLSAAPLKTQTNGVVAGTAMFDGKPLGDVGVRLRNIDTKAIVAESSTNSRGEFRFTNIPVGNYVVEIISHDKTILLGMSPTIALTAGAMTATGITIVPSAAAAAQAGLTGAAGAAGGGGAAAGAAGAGAGAAGTAAGAGGFFASTVGIVTTVAVIGGVTAGVIVAKNNASPSS